MPPPGSASDLGMIEDHQTLATGIDKGFSQADKGCSQATQAHLNPILGAPPPLPRTILKVFLTMLIQYFSWGH